MYFSSRNNRGSTLLWAYFLISVLLILGVAFVSRGINDNNIARRQRLSVQALHIAEAGLERALLDLRLEYESGNQNWLDGWINGINCPLPPDPPEQILPPNWAKLYNNAPLGDGTYTVWLQSAGADKIWIKSTGTIPIGDTSRTIRSFATMFNINPWNNALFAGAGQAGGVMNGNVNIKGSVHILGDGLPPGGVAMELSGSALVGNNYDGIPAELNSRIPSCPRVDFEGENVQSLGAKIRVKRGQVNLGGTSTVGQANVPGNIFKETADGSYVTDGYGGTGGVGHVYSDNGPYHHYDLGDRVSFPSLSAPYGGYATYQEYLRNNALELGDVLSNLTPNSPDFTYSNTHGSISKSGNVLNISGIVYVNGNLNTSKYHSENTILYTGIGSILVTGNVDIKTNFLTQGSSSFPSNIIGIMTPNDITFDAANIDVTGLFYAEDSINSQFQTNVAGAFMSNYFNMGTNVPSLYFVPEIINNLPPGLIGMEPIWYLYVTAWQRE